MVELLRHKVRFGDLSYGPLVHNAVFFDLLIQATEELSYELGYTVEEIVEAGGVPYAPVAIRADLERYPRYEDTIVVSANPVAVGDRHTQIEYRLERASDGATFGRATMVQVTITPEHEAEPVSSEMRTQLDALGFADSNALDVDPRRPTGAGQQFTRDVVFRTPHLEGANLGFFEDYARELSIALEEHLADRGRSLRSLTDETYPFTPAGWEFTLEQSIRFEDEITVVGEVLESADRAVDVAYELRRERTDDICIRAEVTYGCYDEAGKRVSFPPAVLELLDDTATEPERQS